MSAPSFKEVLAEDTAIFVNAEEFADTHTINGVSMPCLIDGNELLERQKGGGGMDRRDGLFSDEILLFVKASDFGGKPKRGGTINVDGVRTYRIKNVTDEDGIYSITMEAPQI